MIKSPAVVARRVRRRDVGVAITTSFRGGMFSLFAEGSSSTSPEDVRGFLASGVVSGVNNALDDMDLRETTDGDLESVPPGRLPRTVVVAVCERVILRAVDGIVESRSSRTMRRRRSSSSSSSMGKEEESDGGRMVDKMAVRVPASQFGTRYATRQSHDRKARLLRSASKSGYRLIPANFIAGFFTHINDTGVVSLHFALQRRPWGETEIHKTVWKVLFFNLKC